MRIYLVEDDRESAELFIEILRTAGHRVAAWVADGGLALPVFLRMSPLPDLVIVDYELPGWNGARIARAIRSIHETLPIIGCSCHPHYSSAFSAIPHTFFLRKPFRVKDLLLMVTLTESGASGRGAIAVNGNP